MDNKGIGVFDSGVGGISVLLDMQKRFPNEIFYYYGDNINAPYGEKSRDDLIKLALVGISKLLEYSVKAIVVACNTLSVNVLGEIKKYSPVPIYGVFPPLERCLINNERTLLLCTTATANFYKDLRCKNVIINPCKTLVKQIELSKDISNVTLTTDVPFYYKDQFKTVILGCTHYLFLKNKIFDYLKPQKIISGNEYTVDYMQKEGVLSKKELNYAKKQVFFVGNTALLNKEFYIKVAKHYIY